MILTNIFYLTINTQKRLSLVIWDNRFKAIIFMLTNSNKEKKVWSYLSKSLSLHSPTSAHIAIHEL